MGDELDNPGNSDGTGSVKLDRDQSQTEYVPMTLSRHLTLLVGRLRAHRPAPYSHTAPTCVARAIPERCIGRSITCYLVEAIRSACLIAKYAVHVVLEANTYGYA